MTPPTTPERCPTCDRDTCGKASAYAAYQASTASDDTLSLAMAMIAAERECLDLEVEAECARRARKAAARLRAFDELKAAAAQWAKVAPLIERLRAVDAEANARGTSEQRLRELRSEHFDVVRILLITTKATP